MRLRGATRRIVTDVAANIRMWWRSPTAVFFTVAFPLIFITIFGAIFGEDEQRYDLVVDDQDGSEASQGLLEALWATNAIATINVTGIGDPAAYADRTDRHSVLVIPRGYGRDLALGNAIELTLIQDPTRTQSATVAAIVQLVVQEVNLEAASARAEATGQPNPERVSVARSSVTGVGLDQPQSAVDGERQERYIDYLLPGVVGMTIATNALIGGLERIASLHETKVMRKIATTPIKRWEWVLGKALYQTFLGFISMVVVVIVGFLLFDVRIRPDPSILVLVPAASILFAAIALILSRWVRHSDAANTAGSTVLFPQMFLTGVFFPLETMPGYLQIIAKALPLTYVNDALRAAMVSGNTRVLWVDGAIVIALAAVGIMLAAWAIDRRED